MRSAASLASVLVFASRSCCTRRISSSTTATCRTRSSLLLLDLLLLVDHLVQEALLELDLDGVKDLAE